MDQKAEFNFCPEIIRPNITFSRKQKGRIGAKRNCGTMLVPCSFWPTISAYLTINCNILHIWFGFSSNFAILTIICKIFCLKSVFRVIRPYITFSLFIFDQYFVPLFEFSAIFTFGLVLQYQKKGLGTEGRNLKGRSDKRPKNSKGQNIGPNIEKRRTIFIKKNSKSDWFKRPNLILAFQK